MRVKEVWTEWIEWNNEEMLVYSERLKEKPVFNGVELAFGALEMGRSKEKKARDD